MKIAILVIALGLTGCVAQGPVVNQSDAGKIVNCSSKFYNPNVKCYKEAPKQTVEQMQANFDEAIRPDKSAQAYRNSDVITREEKIENYCAELWANWANNYQWRTGKNAPMEYVVNSYNSCVKNLTK